MAWWNRQSIGLARWESRESLYLVGPMDTGGGVYEQ